MRFAPEPNAYLPNGHTESICLNFDLANDDVGLGQDRPDRLHEQID
jgi:glutamyl/glutaminyl-tRNA synthetase